MRPDHPLRRLFRFLSVSLLMFIGAVLFLLPEPFTSILGIVLIFSAVLWIAWSRERIEELEELDELRESDGVDERDESDDGKDSSQFT